MLARLLKKFSPSDISRVLTRQKKKRFRVHLERFAMRTDDEEGISVEAGEERPIRSVEDNDEENTSQQRGSFRFFGMEVSKEKEYSAILYCLKIRLEQQTSLAGWSHLVLPFF